MYSAFSPAFEFVRLEFAVQSVYVAHGGLFWDGRADSLAQQAAGPFLNPREMAQPDKATVIAAIAGADYAALFERVYGADALADTERAYDQLTDAIAAYEGSQQFAPFSSKFDLVLRGQAQVSEQEQRGFELFSDREIRARLRRSIAAQVNSLGCPPRRSTRSSRSCTRCATVTSFELDVIRHTARARERTLAGPSRICTSAQLRMAQSSG